MKRAAMILAAMAAATGAHAQEAPICTDRPAKANAVCTVPSGALQLETSAFGWSVSESSGDRAEILTLGASVIKLGLSERSDLQVGFTPFAQLDLGSGRARERLSGFGDVLVRYKHRLTGSDAPVQVALIPLVKLPTAADGLGNGQVEGGLAVPISFSLAGPVTMTLGPELNLLADADGSGRHLSVVNLVNLSMAVAPRVTIAAELWTNINFDPAETFEQASADFAVAYAISDRVQVDAGANLGLTPDTPDVETYVGISVRF